MEGRLCPPPDPGFRLIETCRWTPESGVHLRSRHLARLQATAARLGIAPGPVDEVLDAVTGDEPLRLRLTVDCAGKVELAQTPFAPLPKGAVWRMQLAEERLCSTDPWRGVKTTERGIFDRARATIPDGIDEVLFLNERSELCVGSITNLFLDMGEGLLTPPLSCGVLPGVLRAELLARGEAREAVLGRVDLSNARAVFVGNALRGLIPARMV